MSVGLPDGFLSEEVKEFKAVGGNFIVVLISRGEVLLSSATERPPVLSREEVNKRELEVGSSSSGLFLVSFQALTGGPIVEGGVLPLRSMGILGTNLYGEILNGQSVGQEGTQDVRKLDYQIDKTMALGLSLDTSS